MRETGHKPWLNRYAWLTAAATAFLVVAGALVTSTGSGLAVPDWPLSFGQIMPPMVGGVFFEHGHRMVATSVGMLTIGLLVWLLRAEPRAWVRRLGVVALAAVCVQGLLGGLTVLLRLPVQVSVTHALLAELFFCVIVSIGFFTGSEQPARPVLATVAPEQRALRRLALATLALLYLQIGVGAAMRHMGAGLAIWTFPSTFGQILPPPATWSAPVWVHFAHRVGALAVATMVALTATRVLRHHRGDARTSGAAVALLGLVAMQLVLGALTILWFRHVVPTTAHVAVGALTLATCAYLCLRLLALPLPVRSRAADALVAQGLPA